MEHVTVRCTYCGELFTNKPVVYNGHKYCTTVCKLWDNPELEKSKLSVQFELPFDPPLRRLPYYEH